MTNNNPSQQECHKCNRERGTVPVRCDHHTVSQSEGWLKREYLRGFINGGARGDKKYTVESLDAEYEQYLKDNPEARSTLSTLVKEMEGLKKEIPSKDYEDEATRNEVLGEFNAGISAAIEVVKKMV